MRSVSIAELEATLSEQMAHVRTGEAVVVTDRGRPVARLVPIAVPELADEESRVAALERSGALRRPAAPIPAGLLTFPTAADPTESVRRAVAEERAVGC